MLGQRKLCLEAQDNLANLGFYVWLRTLSRKRRKRIELMAVEQREVTVEQKGQVPAGDTVVQMNESPLKR